jgi:amphi-Trp domain-containing protein
MTEPEKEIEEKYSYSKTELVEFLEKIRKEIHTGEIKIGDENVQIPDGDMEVEYGFKIENGQSEIEIEIKWKKS